MVKKTSKLTITVDDAAAILKESKEVVRPMEWIPKRTASQPQWLEFVSVCKLKGEIREEIFFRAQYRPSQTSRVGTATVEKQETFNAAVTVGGYRIFAVDTNSTPHTNQIGKGWPYYLKRLTHRTHVHLWTEEGYGYAEPVIPALDNIESLMDYFLQHANLTLVGKFIHPLQGRQLDLLL